MGVGRYGIVVTYGSGDEPDEPPQYAAETIWRIHGGPGHTPFATLADTASALLAEEHSTRLAVRARQVELSAVLLLALALYQSGVDQYASTDPVTRITMQVYDIELAPAASLLADPDLSWALLHLSPGHPAWHDSGLPTAWREYATSLDAQGRGDQWQQLRQQARAAASVPISTYGGAPRVTDMLTLCHTWGTLGWYESLGSGEHHITGE